MLPVFLFGALLFFFPVAAYCLFLAWLNSRQHATMIPGPWDFAGVLFATSGFLLGGGPAVLFTVYTGWRFSATPTIASSAWFWWVTLWVGYFALVIGGAVYCLLRRRSATVVYNVDGPVLDELLAHTLDQLQLTWVRVANRIFIGPTGRTKSYLDPSLREAIQVGLHGGAAVPGDGAALPVAADGERLPPELAGRRAGLELEPFPAMCNVVLHWHGDDPSVRHDVEAELDRQLRQIAAPENASASWFLTVSTSLFCVLLVVLIGLILFKLRR